MNGNMASVHFAALAAIVGNLWWLSLGGPQLVEGAQPEAPQPAEAAGDRERAPPPLDTRVVARVDGEPVTMAEVMREVRRATPLLIDEGPVLERLRAAALKQLVDQRLILRNLARTKIAADPREVDVMVQRLVKQLEPRKISLADHLAAQGMDEAGLRRQIAWQMSWGRYLERYVTEANLKRYFDQHAREFDGSEVRVAHILWKVDAQAPASAWDEAREKAERVRAEIAEGKLSFSDAARQHSQAPTAADGGDIGFIRRREPMPESFSKAAFTLEKNGVSQPVLSAFGVHLIHCVEIKPGQRPWNDSRSELETALVQYLFGWLADKERGEAKVEFTGVSPYFKPGTDQVVPAGTAPNSPPNSTSGN